MDDLDPIPRFQPLAAPSEEYQIDDTLDSTYATIFSSDLSGQGSRLKTSRRKKPFSGDDQWADAFKRLENMGAEETKRTFPDLDKLMDKIKTAFDDKAN